MDVWISVISAVVAVISTVITVWFGKRTDRLERLVIVDAHLERIRCWADETIGLIIELTRECRESSSEVNFLDRVASLRTRLSIQVERGRWFFPNLIQDQYGVAKSKAYRGLRQPVLDAVVAAFDISDELDWPNRSMYRGDLFAAQRLFVSEVQQQVNPLRRYEKVDEILDDYRKADSTLREQSIEEQRAWVKSRLKERQP
jgi:hypothetical protein